MSEKINENTVSTYEKPEVSGISFSEDNKESKRSYKMLDNYSELEVKSSFIKNEVWSPTRSIIDIYFSFNDVALWILFNKLSQKTREKILKEILKMPNTNEKSSNYFAKIVSKLDLLLRSYKNKSIKNNDITNDINSDLNKINYYLDNIEITYGIDYSIGVTKWIRKKYWDFNIDILEKVFNDTKKSFTDNYNVTNEDIALNICNTYKIDILAEKIGHQMYIVNKGNSTDAVNFRDIMDYEKRNNLIENEVTKFQDKYRYNININDGEHIKVLTNMILIEFKLTKLE